MHFNVIKTFLFSLRTQNHEAQKVASWNAKLMKIEEASRKKNELNQEFISNAKDTLVSKMEHCEEKRDAIISDKLEKIKVSFASICVTVGLIINETKINTFNRSTPTRLNETKP